MPLLTGSWQLCPVAKVMEVRSAIILNTLALVISLCCVSSTSSPAALELPSLLLVIFYIGLYIIIVRSYIIRKTRVQNITVSEHDIQIPRFLLSTRIIPFSEIKSVEKITRGSKNCAVIVGRFRKTPIVIEQRIMSTESEFDEFIEVLESRASASESGNVDIDMKQIFPTQRFKQSLPLVSIALTLVVIYVIFSVPGLESIDVRASALGALTKHSLAVTEIYRIPTAFMMHQTPLHLGLNVLVLIMIGESLGVVVGIARVVNILLVSAIGGSLLSILLSPFEQVLGASGGISGLLGAYIFLYIRRHQQLPGSVTVSWMVIVFVVATEIFVDAIMPGIDLYSHAGGLLTGFLFTAVLISRKRSIVLTNASRKEAYFVAGLLLMYISCFVVFLGVYLR